MFTSQSILFLLLLLLLENSLLVLLLLLLEKSLLVLLLLLLEHSLLVLVHQGSWCLQHFHQIKEVFRELVACDGRQHFWGNFGKMLLFFNFNMCQKLPTLG